MSRKPASSVRASRKNLHLGFRRPTETGPRSPAVLFAFVLVLTNPDLTQAAPTDEHILTLTPTSMGAPAFGFPSLPTGPFIGSLFLDPLDLTSSRTAESLNHPSLFALTIGNFSWTEADIVFNNIIITDTNGDLEAIELFSNDPTTLHRFFTPGSIFDVTDFTQGHSCLISHLTVFDGPCMVGTLTLSSAPSQPPPAAPTQGIPEPVSLSLFVAGLAGMGVARGRRRQVRG